MVRDQQQAGNLTAAPALAALQREWLVVALVAALFVAGGAALLHAVWEPVYARRWAGFALPVLAYELWFLWRHLDENRRPDEERLLPTLGPGNQASLLRALFLGGVAGFLFNPWPGGPAAWIPAGLYTAAALADLFDGYLARRSGVVTRLGAALDMEYDALGILVAPGLAMWYGQLPPWYLAASLARYLFVGGLWLHRRRGGRVHDLPPSTFRRLSAGLVMSITTVALWPLFSRETLWIVTTIFMLPFAVGFTRDYLVTVGVVDPTTDRYRRFIAGCMAIFTRWLPLLWRAITVAATLVVVYRQVTQFPQPVLIALSLAQLVPALAIAAGIGARSACMVLLFFTSLTIPTFGLDGWRLAILIAGPPVILLGAGKWAIWSPEDRLWEFPGREQPA
jgi:CDP-diacylglycerol--glycerol-3-phosphate 3-phosphatidyltransferase